MKHEKTNQLTGFIGKGLGRYLLVQNQQLKHQINV